MCIILSCKPGVLPSYDMIETCFDNNPDGAGFMTSDGVCVHGYKGFNDPVALYERVAALMDKKQPLVLHFRIGTSGGLGADVTHPYPVTRNLKKLHALKWTAPYGIAHNGVLPYGSDDARHISDTIAFIKSDCFTIKKDPRTISSGGLTVSSGAKKKLAGKTRGSRLCIMDKTGRVRLIGDGWREAAPGIMASNGSYKPWGTPSYKAAAIDDVQFYDDYGLPETCHGCALKKACEVQCPFCDQVAYELGYTPADVDAVNTAVWGDIYTG